MLLLSSFALSYVWLVCCCRSSARPRPLLSRLLGTGVRELLAQRDRLREPVQIPVGSAQAFSLTTSFSRVSHLRLPPKRAVPLWGRLSRALDKTKPVPCTGPRAKRTTQPSRGRQGVLGDLEAGMRGQVREENGLVGPLVEHPDVAGIGPPTRTRKHQEQPKPRGRKRKGRRRDPLANPSEVVHAGFPMAFPNSLTNRRQPQAGVSTAAAITTPASSSHDNLSP
jgi:hypothetical protein